MKKIFFLLFSIVLLSLVSTQTHAQTLQNKDFYEYVFPTDTLDNTETLTFTAPPFIAANYTYFWHIKITKLSGTGTNNGKLYEGSPSLYSTRYSFSGLNTGTDSLLLGDVYGTKQKLTFTGVGTISQKVQIQVIYKKKY